MQTTDTPAVRLLFRAMKVLQSENMLALQSGEGGNTTQRMAEILDRELGFTELLDALDGMVQRFSLDQSEFSDKARAALAKVRRAQA